MQAENRPFFQPWMLLLFMPIIGIVGMVVILVSSEDVEQTVVQQPDQVVLDDATPLPQTIPPRTLPPTPTSVFNQPAPNVTLVDLEGKTFSLADYRGKVVVVNFWATWCSPCVEEMPALQLFYEDYAGEDLAIVLVTDPLDGQDLGTVQQFVDDLGLTLPIGLSEYGQLQNLFGVQMLPSTYFIDAEGIVRNRWIGPIDVEHLANEVELVRTDAS